MSRRKEYSARRTFSKGSLALFLLAFVGAVLWVRAVSVPEKALITSIRLEGSNVVIQAQVPLSSKLVVLESKGTLTDSVWQPLMQETNIADGQVAFRMPRLAENQFFRIRADLPDSTQPATVELSYVAAPALTANGINSNEFVLHFKADIDGSDRIVINNNGAVWKHVDWQWPATPISINGINWNPRMENIFAPPGNSKLLPPNIQFDSAKVEIIQGRDIVACEKSADGLVIYIDDTPPRAATYEFNLRLSTVPLAA